MDVNLDLGLGLGWDLGVGLGWCSELGEPGVARVGELKAESVEARDGGRASGGQKSATHVLAKSPSMNGMAETIPPRKARVAFGAYRMWRWRGLWLLSHCLSSESRVGRGCAGT